MKSPNRKLWLGSLLASGALLAASCDPAPSNDVPRPEPLGAEGRVEAPLFELDPAQIEAERAIKARELGPERFPSSIDWAAADEHRRLDDRRLDGELRQLLADVSVPVLLPDDPAVLERAVLTTGEHWYAVSASWDRHTVFIQGNAMAHRVSGLEAGRSTTGRLSVTRNARIANLAFVEYGAAYLITVECDSPLTDPRCTFDDYIIGLAEGLARAGEVP